MIEAERVSLLNPAGARSLPNVFEIACECFNNARVRCAQRGPMVVDIQVLHKVVFGSLREGCTLGRVF
jgi:hypothetical protein